MSTDHPIRGGGKHGIFAVLTFMAFAVLLGAFLDGNAWLPSRRWWMCILLAVIYGWLRYEEGANDASTHR